MKPEQRKPEFFPNVNPDLKESMVMMKRHFELEAENKSLKHDLRFSKDQNQFCIQYANALEAKLLAEQARVRALSEILIDIKKDRAFPQIQKFLPFIDEHIKEALL